MEEEHHGSAMDGDIGGMAGDIGGMDVEEYMTLKQHEQLRENEAMARASRRNAEGSRGRMIGFSGEDLDRAAGGPWQAGRR